MGTPFNNSIQMMNRRDYVVDDVENCRSSFGNEGVVPESQISLSPG
jgi:hypothetical protein